MRDAEVTRVDAGCGGERVAVHAVLAGHRRSVTVDVPDSQPPVSANCTPGEDLVGRRRRDWSWHRPRRPTVAGPDYDDVRARACTWVEVHGERVEELATVCARSRDREVSRCEDPKLAARERVVADEVHRVVARAVGDRARDADGIAPVVAAVARADGGSPLANSLTIRGRGGFRCDLFQSGAPVTRTSNNPGPNTTRRSAGNSCAGAPGVMERAPSATRRW